MSLKALSSIVSGLVDEFEVMGIGIDIHEAVKAGRPRVLADQDAVVDCVDYALGRKLSNYATREQRRMLKPGGQMTFPGMYDLRERYALDEKQCLVKATDWLDYDELLGLIDMRENQLIADQAHLQKLRAAEKKLRKYWLPNRKLMFCEVAAMHQKALEREGVE
jgi:hypothetical protein